MRLRFNDSSPFFTIGRWKDASEAVRLAAIDGAIEKIRGRPTVDKAPEEAPWTDAAEARLVAIEQGVEKLRTNLRPLQTADKMPEAGCEDFHRKLDEHLHKEVRRLASITPDERAKMPDGLASLFHDLKNLLEKRKDLGEAHSKLKTASDEVERQREGLKGKTTDSARVAASGDEMKARVHALWPSPVEAARGAAQAYSQTHDSGPAAIIAEVQAKADAFWATAQK